MTKIIAKYDGPIYKRGEIITVQGRKFKYMKMVKGDWALRSFPGGCQAGSVIAPAFGGKRRSILLWQQKKKYRLKITLKLESL